MELFKIQEDGSRVEIPIISEESIDPETGVVSVSFQLKSKQESKSKIPFIQYLRPDGHPRDIWIERPEEVVAKANRILQAGFRFEAEVLSNEMVNLTISATDGDYAGELCENGPGVAEAVDRLILNFELP
jgi:hypothetical protein